MKNTAVSVNGIELDSRLFTALNKNEIREYLRYPFFNKHQSEVVATDGHVMLIQKVDAPENQKSGFVDFRCDYSGDIAKKARNDFFKGKVNDFMSLIIDVQSTKRVFPDYIRIIPDATSETRIGSLQDFYADGFHLYNKDAVCVFPDGSYKVTAKLFKKGFFVSNHHKSAFDFGLFEKLYKFFDYPDDAEVYYTDENSPLLAVSEKERKTALVMPCRFDYDSEYVKIEDKKAIHWRVR